MLLRSTLRASRVIWNWVLWTWKQQCWCGKVTRGIRNGVNDVFQIFQTKWEWSPSWTSYLPCNTATKRLSMWPIVVWKETVHSFPTLSKMAKDFLAICRSSVPCERVFSSSRRVVDDLRHNLSSDTVRKIMCLKFWLKLESSETLTWKIKTWTLFEYVLE